MHSLVVSLHDVHPGSFAAVRAQREWLLARGVGRAVLLVIPDHHARGEITADAALCGWLRERAAAGDEIVQHGYHHLRTGDAARRGNVFWTKVYTANEAEFLDLPESGAAELLARGRAVLAGAGLRADGFIAPAWLLGDAARRAVWAAGFRYTTTIGEVTACDGRGLRSQSLCWSARAAWRRAASVAWNAVLWRRVRASEWVRLALHPRDLEVRAFERQVDRVVREAVARGGVFTTYRAALDAPKFGMSGGAVPR
jgi:predicted deacetylase